MLKALRLAFPGVVVIGLGRMAAKGRLPRNVFAGIRIPSTMRTDEAWRAGHEAAASAMTVAGFGPVLVAIIVAGKRPGHKAETILSRVGNLWLLAWLGLATAQASQAARTTEAG